MWYNNNMPVMDRYIFLLVVFFSFNSCAPLIYQSYSVKYIYENVRVENESNPSWIEKTVYSFNRENPQQVFSALVFENGNDTVPVAFLLYNYYSLDRFEHRYLDGRLYRIEKYSDSDIFDNNGEKDPEKAFAKLISYDVYETDPSNGKCLEVTSYRYESSDPVIENRNVPIESVRFDYASDSSFLPEKETLSLYLAEKWVYQSTVKIEYGTVDGERLPLYRRRYLNPLTDTDFTEIEICSYNTNGDQIRSEFFTAEEYQKESSVRVPLKTVLYITETQ